VRGVPIEDSNNESFIVIFALKVLIIVVGRHGDRRDSKMELKTLLVCYDSLIVSHSRNKTVTPPDSRSLFTSIQTRRKPPSMVSVSIMLVNKTYQHDSITPRLLLPHAGHLSASFVEGILPYRGIEYDPTDLIELGKAQYRQVDAARRWIDMFMVLPSHSLCLEFLAYEVQSSSHVSCHR